MPKNTGRGKNFADTRLSKLKPQRTADQFMEVNSYSLYVTYSFYGVSYERCSEYSMTVPKSGRMLRIHMSRLSTASYRIRTKTRQFWAWFSWFQIQPKFSL